MASSLVNFTIDDASGDETIFHSAPIWSVDTLSLEEEQYPLPETLPTGTDTPDAMRLFNGTHTVKYLPSGNTNSSYTLNLGFNGTAIYVYFVLSRRARTECEFHLDDEHISAATYSRRTTELFEYNQLAYSSSNLSLGMHNLRITTRQTQAYDVYLNFDYAVYSRPSNSLQHLWPREPTSTIDDIHSPGTPAQTSTKQHLTAKSIAGGVIGGVITIICIVIGFYLYRRKRLQNLQHRAKYRAQPFTDTRSPNRLTFNEEHSRLMLFGLPSSLHDHEPHLRSNRADAWVPGNPMPEPNINPNPPDGSREEHTREEQRRVINHQLQTVTQDMRNLKQAYMLDQRKARIQASSGQSGQFTNETDAAVHASMLTDMREQMRVMMDQIHHLQRQQITAYVEDRTDDPPPDYLQVADGRSHP